MLHRHAVARGGAGIVAQRIGSHHSARRMKGDMPARLETRQFPASGIAQGDLLDAGPAMLDRVDDGLDRRDRWRRHVSFRTTSPILTMPPLRILQFNPERLIRGSKIALPVISSICRHGIDNRVASSNVSPSQNLQ